MADVQNPPIVDMKAEATESADKSALLLRLDALLEQYLNTLDDYQKAQQQLATQMSSGFMSLAQANFSSHSRTRFGQDYYDERMQASRKISLSEEASRVTFSVLSARKVDRKEEEEESASAPGSPPEDSADLPAGHSAEPSGASEKPSVNDASSSDHKTPVDPLGWFGILVPPPLRSTQTSFISVVEDTIPRLATLAKGLRRQEGDIARLRKRIRKM